MSRRRKRRIAGMVAVLVLVGIAFAIPAVRRRVVHAINSRVNEPKTVEDRLAEFTRARGVVLDACRAAGFDEFPKRITLLGLKEEKRLDVFGSSDDSSWKRIVSYPILAASGVAGPKLREGDKQVPEGVYPIELLNPNSLFHVSMRVGYPNEFDRRIAAMQSRTNLGGDIMIHGSDQSVGCLAMGDPASEELFVLAANVGIENVTVVIAPFDLREREVPKELDSEWRVEMYDGVREKMKQLPK